MIKTERTNEHPHPEWLFGINPDAIELQEELGQTILVNSCQLPRNENCSGGRKELAKPKYEAMGIKVAPFTQKVPRILKEQIAANDNDELFVTVVLPEGWRKEATSHSMWNNLYDAKGGLRGNFFYKAAFYDRDAFINFNCRYEATTKHEDQPGGYSYPCPVRGIVIDNATREVIFRTEIDAEQFGSDRVYPQAKEWLAEHYPNHKDFLAYWD